MKNKRIFVFILIMLLCATAFASSVTAATVEMTDDFYVADYADVISDETTAEIVALGSALDEKTGAQIVILTIDFLDGKDIEDYGYTVFNEWKLGSSAKNNGLLIILAIGEDDYWGTIGAGLEDDALTAGKLKGFFDDYLEADFAAKDYDAGALKLYTALTDYLAEVYGVTLNTDSGTVSSDTTANQTQDITHTGGGGSTVETTNGKGTQSMLIFLIAVIFILFIIGFFISVGRAARRRRTGGFAMPRYYTPNYPKTHSRTTKRRTRDKDAYYAPRTTRPGIGNYNPPSSPPSSGSWWNSGPSGSGSGGRSSGASSSHSSSSGSSHSSGGGFSRGGGAGRSSSSSGFSGSHSSGSGHSSGGGSSHSSGGGFSRGGGAGRGR